MVAYVYGSANKQKQLWEFHLVMFHMQSTYFLKLTVRLTLQFVSVSPSNVRLGQTRSLGLKVWGGGTKHYSGVSTSVFTIFFNIKISLQNKIWRSTKKFREDCPECPPWLQVWFRFSGYFAKLTFLTKQSSLDKRGLAAVTVFSGP